MYTHTTLAQFRAQLATRLQDSTNQFWTNDVLYSELNSIIAEALRTWQLLTGYWRDRGTFNTVAGEDFYDLIVQLPTLLGFSLTTRQSIAAMQYRLLEPATPTAWSGSAMFTLTDLVTALQNRRNRFLLDTGAILTRLPLLPCPPPPIARIPLTDTTIDVVRCARLDSSATYRNLWRTLELLVTLYSPKWDITPGTPKMFNTIMTPPLTIQLCPPPLDVGSLDLIVVQAPAALDPATNTLINVPDDMEWIVKWGALSDLLLREGEAYDKIRGEYCQMRYDHGIKLALMHEVILQYQLQGVTTIMSTVAEMDTYRPGWQNQFGAPSVLLEIGQNLVGISKVPDGSYSVVLDVFRNAVVPVNDWDFIQVGRQDLDPILGYCEHLASFKLGGTEFISTMPLLDSFFKQAKAYNARISELDGFLKTYMQTLPNVSPDAEPIASLEDNSVQATG
jgi:hypothetical protein